MFSHIRPLPQESRSHRVTNNHDPMDLDESLDLDSNDGFPDEDEEEDWTHRNDAYAREYGQTAYQEQAPYHHDPVQSPSFRPGMCVVCKQRPAYGKGGKSYPTCGLTCAGALGSAVNNIQAERRGFGGHGLISTGTGRGRTQTATINYNQAHGYNPLLASPSTTTGRSGPVHMAYTPPVRPLDPCIICDKPCHDHKFVTCGLKCAEKLCQGEADMRMCDYCHRRPKASGHSQCGKTCRDAARLACLLCKSRPKLKRYHLCGKTCMQISAKATPLVIEVPEGHITHKMVMKKFESAWKGASSSRPTITRIFKIIESKTFLQPYDQYKKRIGNEVFRYHGTRRSCTLGSAGNAKVCGTSGCALCGILKTSFKTSLANPGGCFGAGVYSSSAANKAWGYCSGLMLLTKVVIGKPYNGAATSCPSGYNSVEYDTNGSANETIVYTDDAIRPVFLIMFT